MKTDVNTKPLTLKANMLWNSIGSLINLGCQWLMTVLVVRLSNGFDAAGQLALAMSIYNTFSPLAYYRMYTYQISDIKRENSTSEYLGLRVITCSAALGIIAIYSIATSPLEYLPVILVFSLYKIAGLIIDVLHGLDQLNSHMDYIGKSLIMQGSGSLIIFCITLFLTNDLILTFSLLTLWTFLIYVVYDKPHAEQFETFRPRISKSKAWYLLKKCFPLVLAGVACSAVPSIPRQFLSVTDGAYYLGIYASIAAPVAIIQMGATYIYNPLLSSFAQAYSDKNAELFIALIKKASLLIVIIGVASIVILEFIGNQLLSLLFSNNIEAYSYLLTPLVICTFISGYEWFLNDLLVSIRCFKEVLISNILALILSLGFMLYFIPTFSMNGVSFTVVVAFIISGLYMAYHLSKHLKTLSSQ